MQGEIMIEYDKCHYFGDQKKENKTTFAVSGWKFSPEEHNHFEKIISKSFKGTIDQIDIDAFIGDLESLCDDMMRLLKLPDRESRKESRHKIIDDLVTMIHDLESIQGKSICLINPSLVKDLRPLVDISDSSPEWDDFYFLTYMAQQCLDHLIIKIEQIEASDRTEGRPPADREGFTYRIALLYNYNIGKPSYTENGPFYKIVKTAHESIGWHIDPINHIKKALNKLALAPKNVRRDRKERLDIRRSIKK